MEDEELDLQRNDLSSFYNISIDTLKNAGTLEGMIAVVARELLRVNIKNIVQSIKTATSDSSKEFIDDEALQERIYSLLDGITPTDNSVFESRVKVI